MNNQEAQIRILALAIYELKSLLSNNLGSTNEDASCEKLSAHLAHSLHNEALAIIENRPEQFDIQTSLDKIKAVDNMFNSDFAERFKRIVNAEET